MPMIHMTAADFAQSLPALVANGPRPAPLYDQPQFPYVLPAQDPEPRVFYVLWLNYQVKDPNAVPPAEWLEEQIAQHWDLRDPEAAMVTIRPLPQGELLDVRVTARHTIAEDYAAALEAEIAALAPAPTKRKGRPPGTGQYPGQEEFLARLRIGLRVARNATGGRPPTKEQVANGFGIGVRTLDNWLTLAGTSWAEQLAALQEEPN